MTYETTVPADTLPTADLVVDAIYEGGRSGNVGDDPLHPLLGVGNMGGFRYVGGIADRSVRLCVLYSELSDPDWPDSFFPEVGRFLYYGDNKRPGHQLHDTPRHGNAFLRNTFQDLHEGRRDRIPPILVFTKAGTWRDVVFRGLAVPGAPGVPATEDLVAIWRTRATRRFQNYRSIFTILDVPVVERQWLDSVTSGGDPLAAAPRPWTEWVSTGTYESLRAPQTKLFRSRADQLPKDPHRYQLLTRLVEYFKSHPEGEYAFERCAAELVRLGEPRIVEIDLTRPWRDGGRDALGQYSIGFGASEIRVDFALEAKCKRPSATNSSGVRDVARLISRLRHRQFGIFVTTSCLHDQAYREIVEDGHPVVVVSGADVVEILINANIDSPAKLDAWLAAVSTRG